MMDWNIVRYTSETELQSRLKWRIATNDARYTSRGYTGTFGGPQPLACPDIGVIWKPQKSFV